MRLEEITRLLALPSCVLLVLLLLWSGHGADPEPQGFQLPIVRIPKKPVPGCTDPNRVVLLHLTDDGRTNLSGTDFPMERLPEILALVLENRGDRTLYLRVDSAVTIDRFAMVLDQVEAARNRIGTIHLALITSRLHKDILYLPLCALEWPKNEKFMDMVL